MEQFTIKDLTFSYHNSEKCLNQVNLTIQQGEFIVLCGKSGCGKTTLLRHLKSALMPNGKVSGEILWKGTPLSKISVKEQASRIGFVMQDPDNQIVTDKVWHELAFGLESLSVDQSSMRLRVGEMAEYFGISSWFNKNVNQLSGGQKQLLNLASIMAMHPEILIFDEPTSQLDPIAASDFLNTIYKINTDLGITVLLTEHRLEEVIGMADRVIVMEDGKISYNEKPNELGELLWKADSEMFFAMPSATRIFYGTGGKGKCPITVRDGREWMSNFKMPQSKREIDDAKRIAKEKMDDSAKESAVSLKEVWFRYEKEGEDILKGVNYELPKGKFSAIMGGNGAGKSTLLKVICGMKRPYRGKVHVFDKLVWKYKEKELYGCRIALLPQEPKSLFVKKTVREELEEMVNEKTRVSEQIAKVAKQIEIEPFLDRHPYDLSGGEQQRVALAKLIMKKPDVLLLDEPTKGIDCFFKDKLARILKQLTNEGISILMVSHDIEFCAKYVDYVSLFFQGEILTTNIPSLFFADNSFYTTKANRICRGCCSNIITVEDVVECFHQRKIIREEEENVRQ